MQEKNWEKPLQARALGNTSAGGVKTGLGRGRRGVCGCHNKGLGRSQKEVWSWRAIWSYSKMKKGLWTFAPPPGWVIGCGLIWEASVTLAKATCFSWGQVPGETELWVAGGGMSTSALKGDLGNWPRPEESGARRPFISEGGGNETRVHTHLYLHFTGGETPGLFSAMPWKSVTSASRELGAQAEALFTRLTGVSLKRWAQWGPAVSNTETFILMPLLFSKEIVALSPTNSEETWVAWFRPFACIWQF